MYFINIIINLIPFTTVAEENLKAKNPSMTTRAEMIQPNPRSVFIAFAPTSKNEVRYN